MDTPCRGAAGDCDLPEACDGQSNACPADAKIAPGTSCRPIAASCDIPEACGGGDDCPPDAFLPDGTPSLGGSCEPYLCDGAQAACPSSCADAGDCTSGPCNFNVCCTPSGVSCSTDVECAPGESCLPGGSGSECCG
jgi:hypothetical protein